MRWTVAIIAANVIIFGMQLAFTDFTKIFALTPELFMSGAYWQIFSYMWLHGGMLHLTFNMFFLFIFGEVMEHALGARKYISLYIVSGLGSAMFYIFLTGLINPGDTILLSTEMVGASGAVFGVMAAYGLMFPQNKIWLPFLLKPLPAITVVFVLAALEFVVGYFALEPGIANFGHLGGIITGALFTYVLKKTVRLKNIDDKRRYEFFWE